MGARVYLPSLGRFIQVDPVQGGTPNSYVYPPDPVNDNDLTGTFGWKSFASITSVGSFIPGPIGMAACAVSAAAYAKAGDKKNAAMMATTIALAAVGAGGAVTVFKAVKVVNVAQKANSARKAADELTYAASAAKHLDRPYMNSRLLVKEIMKTKPIADPRRASGTVAWHAPGSFNGRRGVYELIVHPQSKKIVHFMFRGARR